MNKNALIGWVFIIAVIAFIVYRKKKKRKPAKSSANNRSSLNTTDPSLISISNFQKVVYNKFVVFDLETTGLDPAKDKIVEIGAVRVENGRITERYQRFIDPGIPMPSSATKVNHITDDMLKGYPPINLVLPHFLKFVGHDVLAAHNAAFDSSFLNSACAECRLNPPEYYFDTMRLNVYWPNLKNKKLSTFLDAAGIENKNAHRALDDAEATAELIIKTFNKIK